MKWYFKECISLDLNWKTRKTYLCAIKWLLKFFKVNKVEVDIVIRRARDELLPMVKKHEYPLILEHS